MPVVAGVSKRVSVIFSSILSVRKGVGVEVGVEEE